jgi:hypothetical protein
MKINSSIARIDWKFHFKTKHDTELNKITLIKNKNVNHNHQIEENVLSLLLYDQIFFRNQYVKSIEDNKIE